MISEVPLSPTIPRCCELEANMPVVTKCCLLEHIRDAKGLPAYRRALGNLDPPQLVLFPDYFQNNFLLLYTYTTACKKRNSLNQLTNQSKANPVAGAEVCLARQPVRPAQGHSGCPRLPCCLLVQMFLSAHCSWSTTRSTAANVLASHRAFSSCFTSTAPNALAQP